VNVQRADICRKADKEKDCGGCIMQQLSFCSLLDKRSFERVRAMARVYAVPKGAVIIEQEQELDRVYIITAGLIELYRSLVDGRRQITGFLGPGDLLSGIKKSDGAYCTAQAITPARLCGFERKAFLDLLHENSSLCYMLLLTATDEIQAQNDHIVLLGRKSVAERLAAFLLIAGTRWHNDDKHPETVDLPMSRSDIADYLGLTIESVSRGFARLRRDGLIETPTTHKVLLQNIPALYDLAGLDEMPCRRSALGL